MDKKCEHKFAHLETVRRSEYVARGVVFKRTDRYFCEKCLEEKIVEKSEQTRGEYPEWY